MTLLTKISLSVLFSFFSLWQSYTQSVQELPASIKLVDVSSSHLPGVVLQQRNSMDAEVVDMDGDGDLDIVIAVEFYKNVILLNDGKGIFTDGSHLLPDKKSEIPDPPYRYYPYHDSEDVAVQDFDKDRDLDIVIVTEDDMTNEYYIKNDEGHYEDASTSFPVTGVTNGLTAADFDGDGWIDLVLANNGQDELLMNRNGKFVAETADRYPESNDITQDIAVVDVDGDGDLDMVIGNENASKVYLNNGEAVFSDTSEKLLPGLEIRETREVDAGDIDGDGDPDLLLSNVILFQKHEPVSQLLINDGQGIFGDEADKRLPQETETGYVDSDLVDIDRDGDLDIIMGGFGGPAIMVNDGTGFFTDQTNSILQGKIAAIIIDVEVADFNNDNINDVYLATYRNGDILLFGAK